MTRQVIKFGAAVMTTLLVLAVFWQFRIVVIYVLISLALAAALRPLVNRLAERKILVRAAWILLYLLALGMFIFTLWMAGETSIKEVNWLTRTVSVQDGWALPVWLEGSYLQQELITRLPPPSELFTAITGSQGQLVLPGLLGFTQGISGVLSGGLIILLLSVYWSISQIHFERLWLSLLPSDQRKQARSIWRTVEPVVGAHIRGQFIQSLLVGVALWFGYWLLGSPYGVLMALASAVASLVPIIGVVVVVLLPLLVGLLTSVQLSIFSVLYAVAIMIIVAVWVKPRLFTQKWDNPILTVVLLIVLADAFGIVGTIIAPPISIICQILWSQLVSHRLPAGAAAQVSDLLKRKDHLQDTIQSFGGPPLPLLSSSMARLSGLLEKAEPVLQAALPPEPPEELLPKTARLKQPKIKIDRKI